MNINYNIIVNLQETLEVEDGPELGTEFVAKLTDALLLVKFISDVLGIPNYKILILNNFHFFNKY